MAERVGLLRELAGRLSKAGCAQAPATRLTVTRESAQLVAGVLMAYADRISTPTLELPCFTVDAWASDGSLVETLAWSGNALIGRAAFNEAKTQRPTSEITLRQAARVIARHTPQGAS